MKRADRAMVMLVLGAIMLRLVQTGGFGWFVQQRMRWPLLAAGAVAAVIGLVGLLEHDEHDDHDEHAGHAHGRAGRAVGWLLLAPVAVMLSVAPKALGSDAALRAGTYQPSTPSAQFPDLPPSAGPLPLPMSEFVTRGLWDPGASLADREVELEGFVVNDPRFAGGVVLTRFMVSCCAADALPLQVAVRTDEQLADDTWVLATVVWVPAAPAVPGSDAFVEAELVSFEVLPGAPSDPYESPY